MQSLEIQPIQHHLNATVRVPGSKSLTNRALLIAALANGTTTLTDALFSDDSHYFVSALQMLGFDVHLNSDNAEMTIKGLGNNNMNLSLSSLPKYIVNDNNMSEFVNMSVSLLCYSVITERSTAILIHVCTYCSKIRKQPPENIIFLTIDLTDQHKQIKDEQYPKLEIVFIICFKNSPESSITG